MHRSSSILLRSCSIRFLAWALAISVPRAEATECFVSPTGNDSNPGSLIQPYRTIQRAADLMAAGDTCTIRGGTYRETVVPKNSGTANAPITYRVYGTERVIFSGTEVITGWSHDSGLIYHAPFPGSLGEGNQVFVDGRMMLAARWPNTSLDVSRPNELLSETGSYTTTLNPDGTQNGHYANGSMSALASGFLTGAKIFFVPGAVWVSQSGPVTAASGSGVDFTFKLASASYAPTANNPFHFFGKLEFLDSPGEWFADAANATLYLAPPQGDAPESHVVEAKRREFGFDFSGISYQTVQDISLFGCSIQTNAESRHLVLDRLQCRYVSHHSELPNLSFGNFSKNTGLQLRGSHHVLRDSHIAYSSGNGVFLAGDHHLVDNCVIHDVNYLATDCAAVFCGTQTTAAGATEETTEAEISNTTCYNSARGLLLIRSLSQGKVHHNHLYRPMLQVTDGGAIYTYGHDGQNTDLSYNRIHDSLASGSGASAIYTDNNSSNFQIHHNLIYQTIRGLQFNPASTNMLWYNNTSIATTNSLYGNFGFSGSVAGSAARNNIFTAATKTSDSTRSIPLSNNITSATNPRFVDIAALDFRLDPASPARDAGMALPPYTDGYDGSAPDAGAFESNQPPWTSGASIADTPPSSPAQLAIAMSGAGLRLDWADNSDSETAFVVERSTDQLHYSPIARLPANTASFTDLRVNADATYHYRVRADESGCSNYVSLTSAGADAFGVIQAESLNGQSGNVNVSSVLGSCDNGDWVKYNAVNFGSGANQIMLRVASGATAINNYIEVRLDGTTGTRIANLNIRGTGGYSNYTSLVAAVTQTTGVHDVYLVFKGGSGVCNLDWFSFSTTATPDPPPAAPGFPSALAVSATEIQLQWSAPGSAVDGIKVEGSDDNLVFTELATLPGTGTSWADVGLRSGARRFYRLQSFRAGLFSAYSTVVIADTYTPQESWRLRYWGSTADSGDAADNQDPDHDGMINLLERAFGGNPLIADAGIIPQMQLVGDDWILSIQEPPDCGDLAYSAECSTNMVRDNWTPLQDLGLDGLHTFRMPKAISPKLFVRIRIDH